MERASELMTSYINKGILAAAYRLVSYLHEYVKYVKRNSEHSS